MTADSRGNGSTGQSGGPILETRELVAGYGQIRALKGISFQVGDGHAVLLART